MRKLGWFFLLAAGLTAEVRTLTLKEAVGLALKQNPDVVLARLEERKAEQDVRLAKAPFVPRVIVGSGLAYSNGFPMSVEGATPSLVQATAISDVFNRPQSYRVAAAKANRRGIAIDAAAKQDEVAYRTAELFLDAERAGRIGELTGREVDALGNVLEAVRARVAEGRELPIEAKRAELNLARARYRQQVSQNNVRAAQMALAEAVGLEPGDQVRPAGERPVAPEPESEEAAVREALASSKEVRSLESKLLAKGYDVRAEKAGRWPRADLVAQYAVLARFNNYDQFFAKFQRNNGQIGVSFQWAIFNGPAISAAVSRAETEAAQLRVQVRNTRNRVAAEARNAYAALAQAKSAQGVAKLDLEVAREQVSIVLAQMQEGRAGLGQVEEARTGETDKWIAFYDAAEGLEKARLNLLRVAGGLLAALQ